MQFSTWRPNALTEFAQGASLLLFSVSGCWNLEFWRWFRLNLTDSNWQRTLVRLRSGKANYPSQKRLNFIRYMVGSILFETHTLLRQIMDLLLSRCFSLWLRLFISFVENRESFISYLVFDLCICSNLRKDAGLSGHFASFGILSKKIRYRYVV